MLAGSEWLGNGMAELNDPGRIDSLVCEAAGRGVVVVGSTEERGDEVDRWWLRLFFRRRRCCVSLPNAGMNYIMLAQLPAPGFADAIQITCTTSRIQRPPSTA